MAPDARSYAYSYTRILTSLEVAEGCAEALSGRPCGVTPA